MINEKKSLKQYPIVKFFVAKKNYDWAIAILSQLSLGTMEEGYENRSIRFTAEMPKPTSSRALLKQIDKLEKQFSLKSVFKLIKFEHISAGSWQDEYQKYLKPFKLFKNNSTTYPEIIINPSGKIPKRLKSNTLYIKASLAFGTGTHASTALAAALLDQVIQKNRIQHLWDLGCGTGILAMIGALRGIPAITATEIDPEALEIARENIRNHRFDKITLQKSMPTQKKFELIVANILLTTLIELKEKIHLRLKKQGFLVLSGLTYQDVPEILHHYSKFDLIERKNQKGWSALLLKKIK